ncbi:MAG: methyltransferase-like protein 23 [Thermacetogenium sp.]|nr:methyltransferase-like protein 23 [Thermacetogenium sp.]
MITTREMLFALPGLELSLEIVANVEELVTDPEDDDQIPYWAELWPAARGLARYIWERVDFQGGTVLELGAGLGLPGLVAACKGGRVTFTDYKPESLEIIARNAARNGIKDFSCFLADWRDFRAEQCFDWIIGSDVLYNPALNPYVTGVLQSSLKPGGQLIFAHPSRPVTLEYLKGLIASWGLREERHSIRVLVGEPGVPEFHLSVDIHHLYQEKRQR